MLDNLRRKACEGLESGLKLAVLILHFDGLVAFRRTLTRKGQTALLGLVGLGLLDNLGIEHHHILAVIIKGNDALVDPNHVGSHAHTAVLVGNQRFQQILRRRQIL